MNLTAYRGYVFTARAPSGVTSVSVAGQEVFFKAVVGADDGWSLTAQQTLMMPAGDYLIEYEHSDGSASQSPNGLHVLPSVKADSSFAADPTFYERVLTKARVVLETFSGSGEISFTVEGSSYGFESRDALLNFVGRLEARVRRQNQKPLRKIPRATGRSPWA